LELIKYTNLTLLTRLSGVAQRQMTTKAKKLSLGCNY